MIEGTKASKPKISEKTTKKYFIIMDDTNPVGVCTSIEMARSCLEEYASKKGNFGKLEDMDVCIYKDYSGAHMITIRVVPRMKMAK